MRRFRSWHGPTRRLARWRLKAEAALGFENVAALELAEELCRWVLSLPWVVQVAPLHDEPDIARFAVACPPLDCLSVWLTMGPFEEAAALEVRVAVPRALAQQGASSGWAVPIVEVDRDRVVIALPAPMTVAELQAVQCLLGVAYGRSLHSGDGEYPWS